MAWVGLHALSGMEMNPTHFSQRGLRRPYLAYPKNRPLRPYYLTFCLFLGKKNTRLEIENFSKKKTCSTQTRTMVLLSLSTSSYPWAGPSLIRIIAIFRLYKWSVTCFLFPISCFLFPISCFLFPISYFAFPISYFPISRLEGCWEYIVMSRESSVSDGTRVSRPNS